MLSLEPDTDWCKGCHPSYFTTMVRTAGGFIDGVSVVEGEGLAKEQEDDPSKQFYDSYSAAV